MLLAFRQEKCDEDTLSLTLPFIDGDAACVLTDEDTGETVRLTGTEMAARGFELKFGQTRVARLLWIRAE